MAGHSFSWSDLESAALKAAATVSSVALKFYQGTVAAREKSDASLVSEADVAVESALRAQLLGESDKLGLTVGFQGEETGSSGFENASGYWLVDPIDGTAAFLSGVPTWSLLIAFISEGRPRVGVVAFPALGLVFCSHEGGRAVYGPLGDWTAQGRRPKKNCHLAQPVALQDARVYYSSPAQFFVRGMNQMWESLGKQVREFRTFGDAFGYACVLQGRAHVAVDPIAAPYDLAAIEVLFKTTPGAVLRSFFPSPAKAVFATGGAIGACHQDMADAMTEAKDRARVLWSQQNGVSTDLSSHCLRATGSSSRLHRQDDLATLSLLMLEAAQLSWSGDKKPTFGPEDVIFTVWVASELGVQSSNSGNRHSPKDQAFFLTLRDEKFSAEVPFSNGALTKSKFNRLYAALLSRHANRKEKRSPRGSVQPAPCATVKREIVWNEKEQLKARRVCQDLISAQESKSKKSLYLFQLTTRVMDILGQDRQADQLLLIKTDSRRSLRSTVSQFVAGNLESSSRVYALTPQAGIMTWKREFKLFADRTD